jgi:hypothetical protein
MRRTPKYGEVFLRVISGGGGNRRGVVFLRGVVESDVVVRGNLKALWDH